MTSSTLLVLIFAVSDKLAKICTREKCYFWNILSLVGNFGDFAVFRWQIRKNVYASGTVISITPKISTREN